MVIEAGFASLIYNAIKDTLRIVLGKKKLTLEEVIAHRMKWKEEFENHLKWINDAVGFGEAIVRDVKRVDSYPNIDEKKRGISPWFKVGLIGIYYRGIELGLRYEALKYDETHEKWRFTDYKENEVLDVSALLVGRIPFDRIIEVDWEGDEYYPAPHIYCRFDGKKKEPYEKLVFAEKHDGHHRPYYTDICSYDEVRKLSKKLKTG